MICEKCGKSNIRGLAVCKYCGTDMPEINHCSGFSDILTFENTEAPSSPVTGFELNKSEGISERDMQKLIKKSDKIIKSTRTGAMFGLIAIGLSIVILICSVVIGMSTLNAVNKYREETQELLKKVSPEVTEVDNTENTLNNSEPDETNSLKVIGVSDAAIAVVEETKYPKEIGVSEKTEDGFVYETAYDKETKMVILTKFDDEYKIKEKKRIDENGEAIILKKDDKPSEFGKSSNYRVELYDNGDVYHLEYDGKGNLYENIIDDTLIAKKADDIKSTDKVVNVSGEAVVPLEVAGNYEYIHIETK